MRSNLVAIKPYSAAEFEYGGLCVQNNFADRFAVTVRNHILGGGGVVSKDWERPGQE